MAEPITVVICDKYGRKSTEDKAVSIDGQLEDADDAILRQSGSGVTWRVGETYCDPDKSASRFAKKPRPDFKALMSAYRAYKPKPGVRRAIALWECSRGSRTISEWAAFIELCRDRLILVLVSKDDEVFDPTKRRDFKELINAGLDAHDESEQTSERCLRGQRKAASKGRPQGKLVYGFTRLYDERRRFLKQVEHEDRGPVVREIFQLIAAGKSIESVVDKLNGRAEPPPAVGSKKGSKAWYRSTVRRIATNPDYLGQRKHLGIVTAEDCWPALVDEVTFRKVSRILADPDRRTTNNALLTHPFSGAIICGRCGGRLTGKPVRERRRKEYVLLYSCRACAISIRAAHIHGYVLPAVHRRLLSPDAAHLFVPPMPDGDADDADRQVDELTARLDRHYETAAMGDLSAEGLVAMERYLLPQIEEARLRQRSSASPTSPLIGRSPREVVAAWTDLLVVQQRDFIAATCDLILDRAAPGVRAFDRTRLGRSRWKGDTRTWADIWAAAEPGI